MLLVIDIGNTNIVLGIFHGTTLEHSWRISTRRNRTVDEYASLCDHLFRMAGVQMDRVEDITVCSVVPPLNDCFKELSLRYIGREPLMVDPVGQSLLPIRYQPKSDVGADRVANSLATLDLVGAPAIAVDFGTATTFDAISDRGEYVGGVIAAGIGISAEALFARTAKLPRIEIARPGRVVGTSTSGSIQSGLFHGYVGLVEGILKRMKEELGERPSRGYRRAGPPHRRRLGGDRPDRGESDLVRTPDLSRAHVRKPGLRMVSRRQWLRSLDRRQGCLG